MDDRRRSTRAAVIAVPWLALLASAGASAQYAYLDALRIDRPHAVSTASAGSASGSADAGFDLGSADAHFDLGSANARFDRGSADAGFDAAGAEPVIGPARARSTGGPAHAIVVNRWARTIELASIAPVLPHGSVEAQVASALERLDARLAELGASPDLLLTLDAYIVPGDARTSAAAGRQLERYVEQAATRGAATVLDVTSRASAAVPVAVIETRDLAALGAAPGQRVRLRAVLLSPQSLSQVDREDVGWDYRSPAPRRFIVRVDAGATWTASPPAESMVAHLERALAAIGGTGDDVDELVIHYDPHAGYREAALRAALGGVLTGGAPRVSYMRPQLTFVAAAVTYPSHRALTIDARGTVVHER